MVRNNSKLKGFLWDFQSGLNAKRSQLADPLPKFIITGLFHNNYGLGKGGVASLLVDFRYLLILEFVTEFEGTSYATKVFLSVAN